MRLQEAWRGRKNELDRAAVAMGAANSGIAQCDCDCEMMVLHSGHAVVTAVVAMADMVVNLVHWLSLYDSLSHVAHP